MMGALCESAAQSGMECEERGRARLQREAGAGAGSVHLLSRCCSHSWNRSPHKAPKTPAERTGRARHEHQQPSEKSN